MSGWTAGRRPEAGQRGPSQPLRVEVPKEGYHRELIPCQVACPVGTDARGYVRAIAEGRYEEAYLLARGPNPFASICGRICGAPCEDACRRGKIPRVDADGNFFATDRPIAIRALKRFACEAHGVENRSPREVLAEIRDYVPQVCAGPEEMAALLRAFTSGAFEPVSERSVAIIGGGPAGLSAAHDLALMGFSAVVYEYESLPGGMLGVGVPEYRLSRELIRREVAVIEALGVKIHYGVRVGEDISFSRLRESHDAVVLAVGAKRSRSLGLTGENGPGVFGGVDLLRAVSVDEALELGSEVVVIGGGNVAYDVARTVVRQAAWDTARTAARLEKTHSVRLVALETLEELPADTVEIREGDEEGVERLHGWGPVEIRRDDGGRVTGVEFQRCLRVYDEEQNFSPQFDEEDLLFLECDTVLLAVGQATDLSFLEEGGSDVEEFRPGWPEVDPETLSTTAEGVFVAGDLAHGTRLLIDAVASGKKAARSIYHYVTGRKIRPEALESHLTLDRYRREKGYETVRRVEVPTVPPAERLREPDIEVERGYSEEEAQREAARCLDCGVTPVFDGKRCVLCGGCADVCPTRCLKLVNLGRLESTPSLEAAIEGSLGDQDVRNPDVTSHSAILKDEDRCIRCALCVMRCPVAAIEMERIQFTSLWRSP